MKQHDVSPCRSSVAMQNLQKMGGQCLSQHGKAYCRIETSRALYFGTLNLKGSNEIGKKEMIDDWAAKYNICLWHYRSQR